MPNPRLRDERLAWLAVRDELERRSRRGISGVLAVFMGARGRASAQFSSELRNEQMSAKMMRYSIVVDRLARQLNPEDRETLRSTGAVPAWFVARVLAEAPKVRLR